MERDPWIALDQGAWAERDGENVVRIALKRPAPTAESATLERAVAEAGSDFVHLIDEIADAVAKRSARSEALTRRALSALQKAETRIRELEARLDSAELRVAQSDQLIARLHKTLRDKFARFATPSSAA